MTYKKFGCFLLRSENNYWDAGKITDILRDQKLTRDYFFSRIYSSMDKLLSFQKKITNFFSIVQGSAREKTQQLLSIRGFTLMIRENNYETAVTYMNPITVRWRQLLIRWKK